jgi:hypothetical protein
MASKDEWLKHTTDAGKTYYFNPVTQVRRGPWVVAGPTTVTLLTCAER